MNRQHQLELEMAIDYELLKDENVNDYPDEDIAWAWPYIVSLGDAVMPASEWVEVCSKALHSIQQEQTRRIIRTLEEGDYNLSAAVIEGIFLD